VAVDGPATVATRSGFGLRQAFARHGGVEVDMQGDAFFCAFARADDAVAAAEDAQRALAVDPVRVRIGLHTGEPQLGREGYVGLEVHRAARICSVAHGGQVVLSEQTLSLIGADVAFRALGMHRLKGFAEPVRLFQLGEGEFPPLDPVTVEVLRHHRETQKLERALAGDAYQNKDLVFAREDGSPIHPQSLTGAFSEICKAARLTGITLHGLRHTHATLLLSNGRPVHEVAARLGDRAQQVLKTCAHLLPTSDEQAANLAASLVG
jgi:Phage integrase family/Adenylate and Guanylate cyclase catalytic domain